MFSIQYVKNLRSDFFFSFASKLSTVSKCGIFTFQLLDINQRWPYMGLCCSCSHHYDCKSTCRPLLHYFFVKINRDNSRSQYCP